MKERNSPKSPPEPLRARSRFEICIREECSCSMSGEGLANGLCREGMIVKCWEKVRANWCEFRSKLTSARNASASKGLVCYRCSDIIERSASEIDAYRIMRANSQNFRVFCDECAKWAINYK